ncbi:MAG: tetratricopeptide repeat protein [Hyphomonadaceae bacterium]
MNRTAVFTLALGAALLGTPAAANNLAFDCQEAARHGLSDPATLRVCNQAVRTEGLSDTERASTHLNRGVVFAGRGSTARAIEDFREAIRLDPNLADAHINLGLALLTQADHAGALAALNAGIALNPREPAKAHYGRALAYESMGQLREAYDDFQRAAELAPAWSQPRVELARFSTVPN